MVLSLTVLYRSPVSRRVAMPQLTLFGEPVAQPVAQPVAEQVTEPVAEAAAEKDHAPSTKKKRTRSSGAAAVKKAKTGTASKASEPMAEAAGEPMAEAAGEPVAEAAVKPMAEASVGPMAVKAAASEPCGGGGLGVVPELRCLDATVRDMQKLGQGSASTQGGDGDNSKGVLVYPELHLEPPSPVCQKCGYKVDPCGSGVRLIGKQPPTFRCAKCCTKQVQLTQLFGSWPIAEFVHMSAEDQQTFWADNATGFENLKNGCKTFCSNVTPRPT